MVYLKVGSAIKYFCLAFMPTANASFGSFGLEIGSTKVFVFSGDYKEITWPFCLRWFSKTSDLKSLFFFLSWCFFNNWVAASLIKEARDAWSKNFIMSWNVIHFSYWTLWRFISDAVSSKVLSKLDNMSFQFSIAHNDIYYLL